MGIVLVRTGIIPETLVDGEALSPRPEPSSAVAPPDRDAQRVLNACLRIACDTDHASSPCLCCCVDAPNMTSLAPELSPSCPAIAVSVCPQRAPGDAPTTGNGRGLLALGVKCTGMDA